MSTKLCFPSRLSLVKRAYYEAIGVSFTLISGIPVNAIALEVAQTPLFLGSSGQKNSNVFFMVDDSSSMNWSILRSNGAQILEGTLENPSAGETDNSKTVNFGTNDDSFTTLRVLCPGYNVLAYNPNANYAPWAGKNVSGDDFPQANPLAVPYWNAYTNPYFAPNHPRDFGDVDDEAYIDWNDLNGDGVYQYGECVTENYTASDPVQCRQHAECHYTGDLSSSELQNYANFRTYYYRRHLVMRSALSHAIETMSANAGFATYLGRPKGLSPVLVKNMNNQVYKDTLLEQLFSYQNKGGTPTRRALKEVGKYFTVATETGEFGPSPISDSAGQCQGNYAILITDGFSRGGTPRKKGLPIYHGESYHRDGISIDNEDHDSSGALNSVFDGGAHADSIGETAADVAMKYYEMDLAPDIPNNGFILDGIDENPAQHMVTYIIAFGVNGELSASPEFGDSASFNWPTPEYDGSKTSIDDLRHAAYNGRGAFLNASNLKELTNALNTIMLDISQRDASNASLGVSTSEIKTSTRLYQVTLNSRYWSGDLISYPLTADGLLDLNNPEWKASEQLPAANDRIIITFDEGKKAFQWSDLSTGLKTALDNDTQVLNYLRGDASQEMTQGGAFRDRPLGGLGDFVNSEPFYLGAPKENYSDSGYTTFKSSYAARTPMLFAGANDGMLHAFNANNGVEAFAYIPGAVHANLNALSNPVYSHQYFTDGSPTVADAYFSGTWHSVLVGGLNAGGNSIYALDVTDVANDFNTEATAKNKILWEYTDANLGLTYSRPTVIKLNNGEWAAVFGNGYNAGNSALYIVNIATGALIKKIDTGGGSGLSTVTAFDRDNDTVRDYIYAGDLSGHLWKFDLSSTSTWDWSVANAGLPIFSAGQAITSRAQVIKHPSQSGYMVYFGTGKYIEDSDKSAGTTQSFYGVWDKDLPGISGSTVAKSSLRQRKILADNVAIPGSEFTARITSGVDDSHVDGGGNVEWSSENGWYLDFNTLAGERVITDAIVRNKQIIFTTVIPGAESACSAGGDSLLMGLDLEQGARPGSVLFDINGDSKFDDNDKVALSADVSATISGLNLNIGIVAKPTVLDLADHSSAAFLSGTNGNESIKLAPPETGATGSRTSWRQLFL